MYKYNVLATRFLPTDAQLRSAMKLADMDTNTDARNLMSILQRVASIERIKGLILTRRTAITAFNYNISAADKSDVENANEAKIRCKNIINYLLKYRVQAAMFGAVAFKLEWYQNPKFWHAKAQKRYKPVELLKSGDTIIKIVDDANKPVYEFDAFDLSVPDYIGEVDESDEYGGALRSIAKKHLMVWETLVEWMNYNIKLKGIIQAIAEGAPSEAELEEMKAALLNVVKNNFTLTDDSTKFNFEQITQAGAFASFVQFIQQVNADTSIALLGQANSSELPKGYGSNAALQVLSKVSADIHYADMQAAEELINRFLVMDFRKNYTATAVEAPWTFSINVPEENSKLDNSEYVRNLRDIGIPVLAQEVYSDLGKTMPEDSPMLLFTGVL